jgi:general secretion pathway protein D
VLAALAALVLQATPAGAEIRLLGLRTPRDASGGVRVELRSDGAPPAGAAYRLSAPSRLVLDLPGVVNATGQERFAVGGPGIARVRLGQHPGFLRVVLDLGPDAPPSHRVEQTTNGLVLALGNAPLPALAVEPPAANPQPQRTEIRRPPGEAPVRIYGIELQAGAERDRVLVFAEHELTAELVTIDAGTVELRLSGATLVASATRRIRPDVGGAVSEVVAFEPVAHGGGSEVRIQIERSAGALPTLSRRGAILAVEFLLPAGARDTGLTLSFVDAELSEVVREVAKATGTSFLFDERLEGRVTLSVVNRVTAAEALQILHSALLSRGFAAVPTPGGAFRILPAGDGKSVAPYRIGAASAQRAAPITTLLRLHGASAPELVAALARLAGSEILVSGFAPTNSVILSGSEAALQRYLAIAQALDAVESEELAVVALRHRDAVELAEILRQTLPPARAGHDGGKQPRFEIWADERSNSVLMRAPAPRVAELRAWLAQLDRPATGEGTIRVIRPVHADATQLAETLTKLAQGDPRAKLRPEAKLRPAATLRLADAGGLAGQLARGAATAKLRPADAGGLAGRRFQVAVHESTNALLVQGDTETQRAVRELVDEIDRRPPTILVDVLVLEVTTARSLALGLDAFLPFGDVSNPDEALAGAFSIQSGRGGVFEPVSDPGVGFLRYARAPLLIPIIGPGGIPTELVVPREIVQITAAEGTVVARTLLRPHLLALSGEEHELIAGDNVPVLVGATNAAGAPVTTDPLTIVNDIERRDVGTILRVLPTAGQAGDVRIELEVEVSRVRPVPGDVATRIGPVIEQRKLSAVARLEAGQVVVLGMVLGDGLMERDTGVPFLKDIPILGWLARSTVSERVKSSLVIALQASIERSQEERIADSIRQRLAFERTLARRGELADGEREGYALLVTTRSSEVEARDVASALASAGAQEPRVVSWEWDGDARFDVYLGGFPTIRAAATAADPLLAEGWRPELVALPPHAAGSAPVPAKQE